MKISSNSDDYKVANELTMGGSIVSGYYLGIDQGTTITTAFLLDESMQVVARGHKRHKQLYPALGWVEHDPIEIFNCVLGAIAQAMQQVPGIKATDILGLGLDHQGETCLVWEKSTGRPIYNAIVWQDRRTADFAQCLKKEHGEYIQQITGLVPDAYHGGTKIKWILDHVSGARERAQKSELLAGTLNTWLIWKLSGGNVFVTDGCSAGRLMLMNIRDLKWDKTIAELINVPLSILPPIHNCDEVYGYTNPEVFFGAKIPICGCVTDSPAGLIGGGVCLPGSLKTSYGTGSFMNLITGNEFVISNKGLTTTCCWLVGGVPSYTLNGASYIAGAAIEWLCNSLELVENASQTDSLAASVPDTNDVVFVPAFVGLATPHWDQYARGCFMGLTGNASKAHLVRAVLESIAFQTTDCYLAMKEEYSGQIYSMRADGGMVDNEFLMSFQADMLGIPVDVPMEKESAAFGAACMAALSLGRISALEDVRTYVHLKKSYEPRINDDERQSRLYNWHKAVQLSMGWAKPIKE